MWNIYWGNRWKYQCLWREIRGSKSKLLAKISVEQSLIFYKIILPILIPPILFFIGVCLLHGRRMRGRVGWCVCDSVTGYTRPHIRPTSAPKATAMYWLYVYFTETVISHLETESMSDFQPRQLSSTVIKQVCALYHDFDHNHIYSILAW